MRVGLWRKLSTEKLMLLSCGVVEDSWESLGLQRDPTSSSWRRSVLGVHWKDWCWSWNSSTLATLCKELTDWKRPWCWEGLGTSGEGGNREWDGWMASPTWWAWIWVNSGSWFWTGRPGVLWFMGSQRVGHNWVTELNWTEQSSGFPYFLQFRSEFGNKEFMIWATVSSQACFCWLYRASPSLAAKNIINLISLWTIWWCPCVESSLVLLEEGVCALTSPFSCQNSVSLCPASFCTPRPNLPVIPGISWLPTFAFQSPVMKRASFWDVNSRRSCRSSLELFNFSFFSIIGQDIDLDYCDIEWFTLEMNRDHSVVFGITSKYCISDSFVDYDGYSISSKGFFPTVVDIMIIWVKFTHSNPF